MRMFRRSSWLCIAFLCGCSTLSNAPHKFVIEKSWVRNTLASEYLKARRIHRFAPIVTDDLVITGNSIDSIVAYDRHTAHERWRFLAKDGCEGGAQIADDTLYFGSGDGQLYALQMATGRVLWSYPLKAEGIARPLVHAGVVYVLGGNNVAHALNAKTGKLLWQYNRREASNLSIRGGSQPAVVEQTVLVGFSDGSLVALNKASGTMAWEVNLNRNKRFRDVDATPVVDGNVIYISSYDGSLYALNKNDGRIIWNVDEGGYDEVLLAGNTVFFSSTSGKTMALDKGSGKIIWSRENKRGIATGPAIYKGVLMVGEMDGALLFYDARTGEFLNRFEPGRGVTSRVTVEPKSGELYFMSTDANLYALHATWKRFAKDWPWE